MIGMRDSSGRPCDVFCFVSLMSPPITIVCPDWTLRIVCTERVLIGGASPLQSVGSGPGMLTSACTSSVTSPPALMCGVTCSSTPVSMYCDVVVTTLVERCPAADEALLADRDLVAGLDRRLLVVERREVRVGDDLGVAVGVEQVQHRLDAAGEVRVVDDVGEALRERRAPDSVAVRRRHGRDSPAVEPEPRIMPPEPRPDGAPPLNSHSTPKWSSSVSVTFGDRDLHHHLPRRNVELLQRGLDHRVLGRRRDDQQRVVVLVGDDLDVAHDAEALGGARDGLRHRAGLRRRRGHLDRRRAPASPVCGWNVGGETIVPAGVPGATVGGAGAAAGAARPVNACVSSGPSFSARWFCRW